QEIDRDRHAYRLAGHISLLEQAAQLAHRDVQNEHQPADRTHEVKLTVMHEDDGYPFRYGRCGEYPAEESAPSALSDQAVSLTYQLIDVDVEQGDQQDSYQRDA